MIDQFYCDKRVCTNHTSAVSLAGINYERIKGTYTVKPVHFACSDSLPCVDVSLTTVELRPIQEKYHLYDPFCWQTFGELRTPTVPPIGCLQIGKPSNNRIQTDHDICWIVDVACVWTCSENFFLASEGNLAHNQPIKLKFHVDAVFLNTLHDGTKA